MNDLQNCFIPQLQRMVEFLIDLNIVCECSSGYCLSGSVPLADVPPRSSHDTDAYWTDVLLPALSVGELVSHLDDNFLRDLQFSCDDAVIKRRINDWRIMAFGSDYRDFYHKDEDRLLQLAEEVAIKPRAPRGVTSASYKSE